MFCKYCGKKLPDVAVFCSGCGKPQNKIPEESPVIPDCQSAGDKPRSKITVAGRKMNGLFVVSLLLMVLASGFRNLCSYELINILGIGAFSWIYTTIGLSVALVLWLTGKINPEKLTLRVLWLPAVWMLLILFYNIGTSATVHMIVSCVGVYYGIGVSIGSNASVWMESVWGAESLWLWAMFILFLCLQSGTLEYKKRFHILVPMFLLVWAFALSLFRYECLRYLGVHTQEMMYSGDFLGMYLLGMFIRRSVCYFFVYFSGTGRLGKLQMALFPVLIFLGGGVLLTAEYIGFVWYNVFTDAKAIATSVFSLSYLFGLLVLLKKRKEQ